MDVVRSNNKATADSNKQVTNISHYIRAIIDIYSAAEIKRDLWLTEREKEFYIATIIHYIMGYVNPISDESVQIYKKYFNYNTDKAKISDYINRIKLKYWLRYDKKNKVISVPEIFHKIDINHDSMTFNLKISYGQNDRPDTDGN